MPVAARGRGAPQQTVAMLAVGRKYGIRVDKFVGWWAAFGIHVHVWPPHMAHLDLHLLWWLITFGRHYAGPREH